MITHKIGINSHTTPFEVEMALRELADARRYGLEWEMEFYLGICQIPTTEYIRKHSKPMQYKVYHYTSRAKDVVPLSKWMEQLYKDDPDINPLNA